MSGHNNTASIELFIIDFLDYANIFNKIHVAALISARVAHLSMCKNMG
jgi:hypothetical protein